MVQGFNVAGQLSIGLSVNGVEIPLSASGFNSFNVFNNMKDILPSAQVSIQDIDGTLFNNMAVGSGTPFEVKIGSGDQFETIKFRVYGTPLIQPRGLRTAYQLNGILDASTYMQGRPTKAYKGKSEAVVSAIAGECGLTAKTTSTDDDQVWIAGPNQTFAKFLHSIVDHGFRDAASIMASTVLDTLELRYVNLTEVMAQSPAAILQQGYAEGELIVGAQFHDQMGFANAMLNHGMRVSQEQLTGLAKKFTSFDLPLLSGVLGMNASEKAGLDHVRNEYAAPDVGNTHENYAQAQYQNSRGRLSLGMKVDVLLNRMASVHLFDLVEFKMLNPSTGQPSIYNGKYIVTAKTRMASGSNYFEKLELSAQGVGGDSSGQFMSPTSRGSSSVPFAV